MAKRSPASTPKAAQPVESVTIRYDLFDLPTAQHKAGLAGIVLAIRSLKERSELAPDQIPPESVPEIVEGPTDSSVTIRFTQQSLEGLFNDHYDADLVKSTPRDKPRKNPRTKKVVPPVETVEMPKVNERTKKTSLVTGFVYLDVTPRLAVLQKYFPVDGLWLKLWRDLIFQVIRDSKKQAPYRKRAFAKAERLGQADLLESDSDSDDDSDEGEGKGDGSSWRDVVRHAEARAKNDFQTGNVSSALWIGAQSKTAESLGFKGRVDQNVLLHFWPLACLVYVPAFIEVKGDEEPKLHLGKRSERDRDTHFVLAIPEVASLSRFCRQFPQVLDGLGDERFGYRPQRAVITTAAEGALEFVEDLRQLAGEDAADTLRRTVSGIDYIHLSKAGNNVKTLANGRLNVDQRLIEDYRLLARGPNGRPTYSNPLMRTGLIQALLREQAWYEPFGSLLQIWPWTFFIRSAESLRHLPWFWADAATRFQLDADRHQQELEVYRTMSASNPTLEPPATPLPPLINRMVRQYVIRKTEAKTGLEWDKLKEKETPEGKLDIPKDWNDAKEKVASDAFLAARSRREQDFVDFFTSTFCQFKQFLSDDEFRIVANALLEESGPEKVKTLTMLALSANS